MSFEEIVSEYKRRERQIKISINAMILKVEQREQKFSNIYENLCKVLKTNSMSSNDFEIRSQKLRSLELSSINAIKEIEEIINHDLKNVNLEQEQKRLKELREKLKATEEILTSSYNQAIIKLKMPKIRIKKEALLNISYYADIAFLTLTIYGFFISMIYLTDKGEEENVVAESDEEENLNIIEPFAPEIGKTESPLNSTKEERKDFDYNHDCILFQNIPSEEEFVEFSNVYTECGVDVVIADDQYGVSYLLDAHDHSKVLFGNFISYGGPYHREDGFYFCILSVDGYDYKLDANDFRTVIDVESTYSEESEPFYLEGYGYVIEAIDCGEKYLIDVETRYAFIRNFDDYEPIYYDEEFGCDVYCFNKYGGNCKYYLAADDLKKVF